MVVHCVDVVIRILIYVTTIVKDEWNKGSNERDKILIRFADKVNYTYTHTCSEIHIYQITRDLRTVK